MKNILAAAGFLAALTFGTVHAFATSLNIDFNGFVTSIDDPDGVTGVNIGQNFQGHMTFQPLSGSFKSLFGGQLHVFNETGSFSWGSHSETGHGGVSSEAFFSSAELSFIVVGNPGNAMFLDLRFGSHTSPPLSTLANLPNSLSGFSALFTSGIDTGFSQMTVSDGVHFGNFNFGFDQATFTVNATPIPATLPLFVSALGGLGLVFWRRRQTLRA